MNVHTKRKTSGERSAEASWIHKYELKWVSNNHTTSVLGKDHGGSVTYASDNSQDSLPKTLIARCDFKQLLKQGDMNYFELGKD